MGVFRRFLNLIMSGSTPGVKLLRRINLTRQQLFYPDTPAWVQEDVARSSALHMEMIRLSGRSFSFRASDSDLKNERKMGCFPLGDCKVICTDNSGGFVFDLSTRKVGTIPPICKPNTMPISVFVPKADVDDDVYQEGNGSSLFLMERFLQLDAGRSLQESNQFVGVINRRPATFRTNKSWHCHLLAPPPFLREPCYWDNNRPEITAYGVVGGGSQVCISVKGVGTYCLDTASHTWSEVGKWMLPFEGKVEYVPEFKLWFGLSAGAQQLAAADLSNMDSEPHLVGPWKELEVTEEWKQHKDSQFVNLGSGRFCIARFFQDTATDAGSSGEIIKENFTVLTGVEVNVSGDGKGRGGKKVKLQMTPHKAKRVNNTSIDMLF